MFIATLYKILIKHLNLLCINILDYICFEKCVDFPQISVFLKPRDSISPC